MKTHASEALPQIEIIGYSVRIHLNEVQTVKDMNGVPYTDYCYDTAIVSKSSSRPDIIQAIIASQYSVSDEIALINNQQSKPVEYAAYQDFRATAKLVADTVLLKLNQS